MELLTTHQPMPRQSLSSGSPPANSHHVFLFSMAPNGVGHPFGQPGPAVLAVSPPSSWGTPSLLAGRAAPGAGEALALCEHCFAATETSLWYHAYFHHKSKTQHDMRLCK